MDTPSRRRTNAFAGRAERDRISVCFMAWFSPLLTFSAARCSPAASGREPNSNGSFRQRELRAWRVHSTAEDVDVWLNGTLEEELKLERPRADEEIVIMPYDEKMAA